MSESVPYETCAWCSALEEPRPTLASTLKKLEEAPLKPDVILMDEEHWKDIVEATSPPKEDTPMTELKPNHEDAFIYAYARKRHLTIASRNLAAAYLDLDGQNRDLVKALQELHTLSLEGELNGDFDDLDEYSGAVITKMDEVIKAALLGLPAPEAKAE